MADPATIKKAFERNAEAIRLKPSIGKSTGVTRLRVVDGTTCEIESAHWNFKADVGKAAGGNDAGPGPGIFERAALGSCLAIGYATWAAYLGVPIEGIEVDVETDFDARGMHDIDNSPPGFTEIRYHVRIASPASEKEIMDVLDKADARSPVRDDFTRAIPMARTVEITQPVGS